MFNNKILTVQDISCFGQCSITVALPVLSTLGLETAILPSAILSTHTAGFKNYVCTDLTEQMPLILNHWQEEHLKFKAIYTGYLGKVSHIDLLKKFVLNESVLFEEGFKFIVDPVMADGGKLYPAFDRAYVEKMKELTFCADIILPNITEACFLADMDYKEHYDERFIKSLLDKLKSLGAKLIILTGVSFEENTIGVFVSSDDRESYYKHRKLNFNVHGTGDLFASVFVGSVLNGVSVFEAAKLAANFVLHCLERTKPNLESHWWGVKFEPELSWLMKEFMKLKTLS